MQRIILTYGAIAGFAVIITMVIGLTVLGSQQFTEWLGFLVMIVGLSLIFFGIKAFRDVEQGGVITFGKAVLVGTGIAAVAGVAYVAVWEVYLAMTDYAFINQYTEAIIEERRAAGASDAQMTEVIASMDRMKEQYANPLTRLPWTFIEIFPVGLLISLISAAVLRKSEVLPAAT